MGFGVLYFSLMSVKSEDPSSYSNQARRPFELFKSGSKTLPVIYEINSQNSIFTHTKNKFSSKPYKLTTSSPPEL